MNVPSLTPDELNRVGNLYQVHGRIDTHEFNSKTQQRNAQLRLMIFMQRFNHDHQGFEQDKDYFVRTYRDVNRFYHNAVKRIDTKSKQAGNDLKFQTASLKATDIFRRQVAQSRSRLQDGENFTFVSRQDGMIAQLEDEDVARRYNDMWNRFAATYPHPEYREEVEKAEAALNSNLNDPGDVDNDGNTYSPAGTSARAQAYEDSIVPDINGDGKIDERDKDLQDGHVDEPQHFSQEELAELAQNGLFDPDEVGEPANLDDFENEPDFM